MLISAVRAPISTNSAGARSCISRASLSAFQQAYPQAAAMKLGIVCRVNMWRFRGSESQSRNRCTSWKVDHFGRASSEPSSEVIKGVHLRWSFAAYLGMHDRTDFHVAPNSARRRVAGGYGMRFAEYMETANDSVAVLVQAEHIDAVERKHRRSSRRRGAVIATAHNELPHDVFHPV